MISIYIHIPFCNNICSYCDFSKIFYNKSLSSKYLNSLENEIKSNYKGQIVKSIYIGGGTPSSLDYNELEKLFKIVSIFKRNKNLEFTIECNPDLTLDKIKLFKKYGVNRVSIGVQTFNKEYLSILNRNHNKKDVFNLVKNLKDNNINNINIDLIFGINGQKLSDIKKDLKYFIKLNIPHLSYYSLILESHTKLYIDKYEEIDDDIEANMYEYICKYLKRHKFNHYEISNFSKDNYESIHNLTYWNNDEYFGFGLSSHGYINGYRYENTKSINKYISGNYLLNKYKVSKKEKEENEMFLGLRKLNGIDLVKFKNKFNIDFERRFNCDNLLKNKLLIKDNNRIYIPEDKLFISNSILVDLLSSDDYE